MVVDEVLGDHAASVLVCDFYAAYHHYDGPIQRCWVHLLRDIHDLRTLYPDDAPLARWADAVHGLYDRAKACTHPQEKRRRTAQLSLERQLLAICQPFLDDPSTTPAKLCRRIERHIKELFVFVAEPEAPPDNNAAERSLRHLVVSRKISGGTRSERGTAQQDDPGLPLLHLARPGSQPPCRLPTITHYPASLNSYPLTELLSSSVAMG